MKNSAIFSAKFVELIGAASIEACAITDYISLVSVAVDCIPMYFVILLYIVSKFMCSAFCPFSWQ